MTLVLAMSAGGTAQDLATRLAAFLSHAGVPAWPGPAALRLAGIAALRGAAPFILAALLAGVAASVLQTGFLINGSSAAA